MFLLGVLFLTATALAQPTVYVARSSIAYPRYRMFFDETVPKIIKEADLKEEPETTKVPEAPLLEPLPIVKSVEIEVEEPKEKIDEKKEEELEYKSEEERKEEVLKEEGPKKDESEEDKKVVVRLEVPKPPNFVTSFMPTLPITMPSFDLPFNFASLWKPKEKELRLVPTYDLPEWI